MKIICFVSIILIIATQDLTASMLEVDSNFVVVNSYLLLIKIEKDAYRVVHKFPWQANSLLVRVGEKDFVLADTPIENRGSEALVKWLEGEYGDVNLTVINCHFHIDCLGGNHYMVSRGFPVYASDMTLQLFEKDKDNIIPRMLNGLKDSAMIDVIKNLQLTAPDHIFKAEDGMTLQFEREDVEIYYPGPAHTEDNIVVYFPKRKILFGGCMVKGFEFSRLGYLAHANVAKWPASLKNLLNKFPDAKVVVPGHGGHGSMGMIDHTLTLLNK